MMLLLGIKGFHHSKKVTTREIQTNDPSFMNPMISLLSYYDMRLFGECAETSVMH